MPPDPEAFGLFEATSAAAAQRRAGGGMKFVVFIVIARPRQITSVAMVCARRAAMCGPATEGNFATLATTREDCVSGSGRSLLQDRRAALQPSARGSSATSSGWLRDRCRRTTARSARTLRPACAACPMLLRGDPRRPSGGSVQLRSDSNSRWASTAPMELTLAQVSLETL